MARFDLQIDYSPEKMELSRRRLEARNEFRYVDRVPVQYGLWGRYLRRSSICVTSISSRTPRPSFTGCCNLPSIASRTFPKTSAWNRRSGCIRFSTTSSRPAHMAARWDGWRMVRRGPSRSSRRSSRWSGTSRPRRDAGLRGKAIEWWREMKRLAAETKVTFNGREGRVDVEPLALGFLSPHMIAIDLVGENFYWWMLEYPGACHRFLDKITQAEIISEENTRKIDPRPRTTYALAEDSAQIMSADMFRKFCVPYSNVLFERFGDDIPFGRTVHMCGKSTHLHKALKEDLKMNSFWLLAIWFLRRSPRPISAARP